jgi:hypothetical protein
LKNIFGRVEMKNKKTFLLFLASFGVLFNFMYASAVNPAKQVDKFIKALIEKDFDAVFKLVPSYQYAISNIKANKPKVLWEKLISEYYESQKNEFLDGKVFQDLMGLLIPPHERKILETRGNEVYISLKYPDVENSPLFGKKLLKETILNFHMSEEGMYVSSNRVIEGDVYWENIPLRVLNVRWNADRIGGGFVEINGIGGTPPYRSTTACGKCILESIGQAENVSPDCIQITLGRRTGWIPFVNCMNESGASSPFIFIVNLSDNSGQKDTAYLSVPEEFGYYCWVANPWQKWRQGNPYMCHEPRPFKPIENNRLMIFEEDFMDNSKKWYEETSPNVFLKVQKGKYLFNFKGEKAWTSWYPVPIDQNFDFEIEATIKKISGDDNKSYGLLWGNKNINHYHIGIKGNGQFVYTRNKNKQDMEIIYQGESPYINKYNSSNKLTIRKIGDNIEFFINDNLVHKAKFEKFEGNTIGFKIYGELKIEIDKITFCYFLGSAG